jgi:branched-chain amino acid transport system permease protein
MAAILAGVTFAYIPELFASYLPTSIAEVPTIMFGVGAILVARNPGGALDMNARQIERALHAGSSLLPGSRVKDPIEIKVTEP